MQKNFEFRRKNFKGARIEDLYFKIEQYKQKKELSKEEVLTDLQKYIELVMSYEKV